ncbi:MAG: type IV pilin N-terminal domain-containing protein [Methanocorpusculum sp.]|nr:type IV pilin N-terminal domain-containing protein [Methanocorpusculum sp.]
MKQERRKEDAVSPVIGIMLMLVVTIIIAAVITGFATDLSADTAKTPMALFEVQDVEMVKEGEHVYLNSFGLKHKGGDAVPLKYLQLTVEQLGGAGQNGIINIMTATEGKTRGDRHMVTDQGITFAQSDAAYPFTIRGETGNPVNYAATTGDVIEVHPLEKDAMRQTLTIFEGATAKWTLSDTRTNAVIASGEFLVVNS